MEETELIARYIGDLRVAIYALAFAIVSMSSFMAVWLIKGVRAIGENNRKTSDMTQAVKELPSQIALHFKAEVYHK